MNAPERRSVLILTAALMGPASALPAQRVQGRVLDGVSEAPVAAAAISLLSADSRSLIGVETDSIGVFSLPLTRSGEIRLRVEALGYARFDSEPIEVGRDELVEVVITLSAQALELPPLVVTARREDVHRAHRDFYRRRGTIEKTGFGRVLDKDVLERAFNLSSRLVEVPAMRRHRAPDGTLRVGDELCPGGVFLNGMFVGNSDLDTMVFPIDLEGVEVYRSEAEVPPELAIGSGVPLCTVVALWTRVGTDSGGHYWLRMGLLGGLVAGFITYVVAN